MFVFVNLCICVFVYLCICICVIVQKDGGSADGYARSVEQVWMPRLSFIALSLLTVADEIMSG